MKITAKYSSVCPVCCGYIDVGEDIEWTRGQKARHILCAQGGRGRAGVEPVRHSKPAQDPEGSFSASRGSGYGSEFVVGDLVRRRDGVAGVVLRASRRYIREDGLSCGVGDEEGWIYSATCRPATPEEIAADDERRERRAARRGAAGWLHDLVARSHLFASYESLDNGEQIAIDGETVWEEGARLRLVGGGCWILVAADRIWFVRNNGADGDDWAHNNIRTGGAGAIGRWVPRSADAEDWIRAAVATA